MPQSLTVQNLEITALLIEYFNSLMPLAIQQQMAMPKEIADT